MDVEAILDILLHGNQLKRTARTGWVQRGVPNGENVAAHTFGVAYATLLLAQLVEEPIDLGKALALALLHDLPEGLTTDIPAPAWRYLPAGSKAEAERRALDDMVGDAPFAPRFSAWWEELALDESAEARLVHDADKVDMFLQAVVYEEQTGNAHLQEFWDVAHEFHYPAAQAIYDALRERRPSIR
ncbi:MAG: HD domain-containing protein [Candidatus Promineifilaceae bacterium]|nr:HD domain-containing protein [Candidatus Promineifilaceae bacterium]